MSMSFTEFISWFTKRRCEYNRTTIVTDDDVAEYISSNEEFVKSNIDTKDKYGRTILFYVCIMSVDATRYGIVYDYSAVMRRLIEYGSDLNCRDNNRYNTNGWTLLHTVCSEIHGLKYLPVLLSAGADPNIVCSNKKNTPLIELVKKYSRPGYMSSIFIEIIKVLIEHGADVNAVDNCGMSALYYASKKSSFNDDIIQYLLSKGAETVIEGKSQLTSKYRDYYNGVHSTPVLSIDTQIHIPLETVSDGSVIEVDGVRYVLKIPRNPYNMVSDE